MRVTPGKEHYRSYEHTENELPPVPQGPEAHAMSAAITVTETCLLLDDGEECVCVQSISYSVVPVVQGGCPSTGRGRFMPS